jgi:hypothetical protein
MNPPKDSDDAVVNVFSSGDVCHIEKRHDRLGALRGMRSKQSYYLKVPVPTGRKPY